VPDRAIEVGVEIITDDTGGIEVIAPDEPLAQYDNPFPMVAKLELVSRGHNRPTAGISNILVLD
jgi:hypothetical protein